LQDITAVKITGLEDAKYVDKVEGLKVKSQSGAVTITGETDRVYSPANGSKAPVTVVEAGTPTFKIARDNLDDVVVWNPWSDKAGGMGDFTPKDGYKKMICVEAGAVKEWQKLEAGDAFEGAQTITLV